jgi:6-phosphogluconolactonase (cycloisomerase 2 family)
LFFAAFFSSDPFSARDKCFAYVARQDGNAIPVYGVDGRAETQILGSLAPSGFVPASIAIDPNQRFAFMASRAEISGAPGITVFTIDPQTGSLSRTSGSYFPVEIHPGPNVMAVHPSGKFLYAATAQPGARSISAFSIDVSTSALAPIPGSPYPAGPHVPQAVTVDPTGKFLFAGGGDNTHVLAFAIDASTGALSKAPGSPFSLFVDTFMEVIGPTGRFLYASEGCRNASGCSIGSENGIPPSNAGPLFPAGDGASAR